jgi:hypothetical protein
VRLPVVCSILAHVALLLIALRLPPRELVHAPRSIDIEIRPPRPQRQPPPLVLPPTPPPPEPLKPDQRPRHDRRETETPPPKPIVAPPTQPPPSQPQPTQPPPPEQKSSLSMRPTAPVDLNLHGLGGIIVQPGGQFSGGEGGPQGTLAAAPRKPWKPRGDAGDPILGKLPEEKEERFPLTLENDGYHYGGPSFSARIAMDGTVTFEDHTIRDFKGLSGGFDLTDIAMKAKHQDPYRYEKEKFMEKTGKLRGELTTKARRDRLESSLAALPEHLEQVWADLSQPAKVRRRTLYAMWREASGNDVELGVAAKKARTTIEGFIRDRLPEGSTDAFTEDELTRLNARPGAPKFDPYRHP